MSHEVRSTLWGWPFLIIFQIRTPLSGIVGLTDICLETAENDHQHHLLEMLKTSADHLLHLVNDILDYSKIEADKLELSQDPFNLKEVRWLHWTHTRTSCNFIDIYRVWFAIRVLLLLYV